MRIRLRRTAAVVALIWLSAPAPPAAAAVEGDCTVTFNGVEVDLIDSLSSPLELGHEDLLVFGGVDPNGTTRARVEVALPSVTLDHAIAEYGAAQLEFAASLELADISPYTVGLFRVRAYTDHCTAEAWVRVSGRLPPTTLVGLTASGLLLGGLAAQISAALSRRRWSLVTAALAGLLTGVGGAVLGQQFGRLQLSYWSLGASVAVAALAGAVLAYLMQRRRQSPQARSERPRTAPARPRPVAAAPVPAGPEAAPGDTAVLPADSPLETPAPLPAEPRPEPAATPDAEAAPAPEPRFPYWGYVLATVDVLHLDDHTRKIGELEPGSWYLVKREVGEWAHVVAGEIIEGWAAARSVHRQP